jgi:fused signal recognition particle receptor
MNSKNLLITSDMGAKVAARIAKASRKTASTARFPATRSRPRSPAKIAAILKPREKVVDFSDGPPPRIVLFVGVNGSGKTTTIGKIAAKLSAQGANVLLAAGDTFRAAAVEQLKVWARAPVLRQLHFQAAPARTLRVSPTKPSRLAKNGRPRPRADRHRRPPAEQGRS